MKKPKSNRIFFRVTDQQYEMMSEIAEKLGVSISDLFRSFAINYLILAKKLDVEI